jgi:hypothetical protein
MSPTNLMRIAGVQAEWAGNRLNLEPGVNS